MPSSSALHAGSLRAASLAPTMMTKDSASSASAAWPSSFSQCAARPTITSGMNGGLSVYDPRSGWKAKKEPSEPNGASVSAKAEQKVS